MNKHWDRSNKPGASTATPEYLANDNTVVDQTQDTVIQKQEQKTDLFSSLTTIY
jgi:hypothetical protein